MIGLKKKKKKLALQPEKELTLKSHYWKSREEEGKDCHSGLGLPFYVMSQPPCPGTSQESHISRAVGASASAS